MIYGQSDPPIVLGDGRADHEGKGRAGRLHEHSTHAPGRIVPTRSVSRTLLGLSETAEREPSHRFRLLRSPLRDRSEEPGAGKPHAGICEGGAGQPASLPQWPL
jgi:hypothetical protein